MMEQFLRMGATAVVIGFASLGMFGICCITALAVVWVTWTTVRVIKGSKNDLHRD